MVASQRLDVYSRFPADSRRKGTQISTERIRENQTTQTRSQHPFSRRFPRKMIADFHRENTEKQHYVTTIKMFISPNAPRKSAPFIRADLRETQTRQTRSQHSHYAKLSENLRHLSVQICGKLKSKLSENKKATPKNCF